MVQFNGFCKDYLNFAVVFLISPDLMFAIKGLRQDAPLLIATGKHAPGS